MSTNAFLPTGNTVVFLAATTPPTPVQAISNGLGTSQYRFINSGSVTVFIGVSTTSAGATANAVVISTTAPSVPLLPGTDEIISFAPNAYFTGITSSATASVYVTPGDGL
jgi:hypothetical protein